MSFEGRASRARQAGERGRFLRLRRGYLARLAVCVLASACAAWVGSGLRSPEALYGFMGGSLLVPDPLGSKPSVIYLLMWLAPAAAFCYLFSDYLPAELESDASVALPRTGSRMWWAARRLAQLALFSVAFGTLGPVLAAAGLLVVCPGVDACELLAVAALCAALGSPSSFLLAGAANCIALRGDAMTAFASVLGVHAAFLAGLAYAPYEVAVLVGPWTPFVQGVLAWHDCPPWLSGLATGVAGFGVWTSVFYLVACDALVVSAAVHLVRSYDIL